MKKMRKKNTSEQHADGEKENHEKGMHFSDYLVEW